MKRLEGDIVSEQGERRVSAVLDDLQAEERVGLGHLKISYRAALIAMISVMLCVLSGEAADAELFFPIGPQIAPAVGSFGRLNENSVAVDNSGGKLYVADSATGSVDVFSLSGVQESELNAGATPTKSFGGGHVSVAVSDASGSIYVLNTTEGLVDVFDRSGTFRCEIASHEADSTVEEEHECDPTASKLDPPKPFADPSALAVDQSDGDLYVFDQANEAVDVFSSDGTFLDSDISMKSIPGGWKGEINGPPGAYGIAVDSTAGLVYLANASAIADVVYVFNTAGTFREEWTGISAASGSLGGATVSVASYDAGKVIFVADGTHKLVDVFTPEGEDVVTEFGDGQLPFPEGLAVDQATGEVFVSTNGEPPKVETFGPGVTIPDVTVSTATGITASSATLRGAVNPAAVQLTGCVFEIVPVAQFERSGFAAVTEAEKLACEPAAVSIPPDNSPHMVQATVSGLSAGGEYRYRLEANNANGQPAYSRSAGREASELMVTLAPPAIRDVFAEVTSAQTVIHAKVNPNGSATEYRIEWGRSESYGEATADVAIGSEVNDVPVSFPITELKPNTTYFYRVVASNARGTATSEHTFIFLTESRVADGCANEQLREEAVVDPRTSGSIAPRRPYSTGLPDCRAFEMVTPARKNAALIGAVAVGDFQDIAGDGNRMMASSVQCFAQSKSCNAARQSNGEPFSLERGPSGWMAVSLAPPASPFSGNTPFGVSADAGTALFAIPTPPVGEDDFYRRNVDGTFTDIGQSGPAAGERLQWDASVVLATSDATHIAYTGADPSRGNGGTLWVRKLVLGEGPVEFATKNGTTERLTECDIELGSGIAIQAPGEMAADGRQVVFSTTECGTNVIRLYIARETGGTSVTTRISGRSRSDCDVACQSSHEANAVFQGAGNDGASIFFTSAQQLTTSATEGSSNLYAYDVATEDLSDLSAGDTSGGGPDVLGVLAIAPDGSTLYFVAGGVLTGTPNQSGEVAERGADNLYMYQRNAAFPGGRLVFVAKLASADASEWVRHGDGLVANVTPDGNQLVFTSFADLTRDDKARVSQVFRYDAKRGALIRVSRGEGGFNDDGNGGTAGASIVGAEAGMFRLGPARSDPSMSNNGRFVYFESPDALTPGALSDTPVAGNPGVLAENVYEWAETGSDGCAEAQGCVRLISDGSDVSETNGASSVQLLGADETGSDVFFTTADPLVGQDEDSQRDIYDARVDGGFPAPAVVRSCESADECHAGGSVSPVLTDIMSEVIPGPVPGLAAPPSHRPAAGLTRAQKLAKALRACRKARRSVRAKCARNARKKYGTKSAGSGGKRG